MNRRAFLLHSGAALGASLALPAWADGFQRNPNADTTRGRVLVLLELRGGNDGLNTVIPFRDPAYRQARPSLAVSDGPVLNRDLILHPALAALHPIWKARRLAFALGVGWPQPNRSHFKASDQWATGSASGSGPGWLASASDRRALRGPLVALGAMGSTALEGGKAMALQMAPALLHGGLSPVLDPSQAGNHALLRRMVELEADSRRELIRLRRSLRKLPDGVEVPRGGLGQQVVLALQLIGSETPPPVIQMSQGGYDTHAGQAMRHRRVLSELAAALASFDRGLKLLPSRPQVSLLVTSEFGRRLRENDSGGTDHGSASVAILMGNDLPYGFLGNYPSLTKLDDHGDLIPSQAPQKVYKRLLDL